MEHARRMMELYVHFMQRGDVVIDVGANIGNRTRIFSELGARVIAVEPQKECVRLLYIQFHDNPRVTIVPQALGAAPGRAEIRICQESSTISSLSPDYPRVMSGHRAFKHVHWTNTRSVPLTTLDALIAQFGIPAFTKIDVEGYESEVLQGLSQSLPALSFEFTPYLFEPARASIARLEQLDAMRYNYARMEDMELRLDTWVSAAEMLDVLEAHENTSAFIFGDVYARRKMQT